ncbi:hypothetical protein pipiens_004157 [Culex pipiens pipiens]|uniref:Uncharacterized protein n=1 Tax=Culex pipiens pipiens TaxID=38569 RepID=A0ABD1CMB8_CULPP
MKLAPLVVIAVFCVLPNATSGYKYYMTDARHASYPNKCYAPVSQITVTRGFELYEGCRKWTCDSHYTMTKQGYGGSLVVCGS